MKHDNIDHQHIWHPYTTLPPHYPNLRVKSAEGAEILLSDGRRLVDGMASWWSAIHGYNHPVLNKAVVTQLQSMAHVMFGGLTHAPAENLAKQLLAMLPPPLECLFYADSGSIAVEVALKMAIQYWRSGAQPKPHKSRVATIRYGYHGDTFATMALSDPENGMHRIFRDCYRTPLIAEAPITRDKNDWFSDPARDDSDIADMARLLESHHEEIAAVILEPICQGAGGMRFYSPVFLRKLRALCDQYEILLIFDEIATGFGRTGKLFALEHTEQDGTMVIPDILCLGKALTGGYMTLAVTVTTRHIAERISESGPLMHGPTFMGNPLACSVASASLQVLSERPWQDEVGQIEHHFRETLMPLADSPYVREARVLGAIGVIETRDPIDLAEATPFFVKRGVWLRPFGHLLYAMPPYCISPESLRQLTDAMADWVEAHT
ncbi:MAG: adenosylmethionine--8-amino-7-oxononanoate transaminase [Gammaproteobacteria bacterium]|nr:MAG: adenosylmethionine--8-amino-7-oxononanoate transaminase [Gammaproteobacteria bacterium]